MSGKGAPRGPAEGKQRGPSKPVVLPGRERGARDDPEEPHPPLALPPAQQGLSPECGWLEGCGGVAWLTSPVPSAEVRFPPV